MIYGYKLFENFTNNIYFEWESGQHVEAKAESCDIDCGIMCGKVVQDITLGLVAEDEVPGDAE